MPMPLHRRLAFLLLAAPAALHGQSEAALKEYFEGKTVTVKIAMPGTEDGVDIYPGTAKPLDYPRHADRLKDNGTALRAGDDALVTKVKVKAKLIEFQLDGGGYGTMGDETSSNVSVSDAPKTKREQNLEGELKRTSDPARRREIKEELDDLKADRERENARNRANVADARGDQEGQHPPAAARGRLPLQHPLSERRARVGADARRDQGRARGLRPVPGRRSATEPPHAGPAGGVRSHPPPATNGLPSKGMLTTEVDQLLGTPEKSTDRLEGRLKVNTRIYPHRTRAGSRRSSSRAC